MVDANLNLLPVANAYFARSDYVYNVGWNDSGMPATVNYNNTVTGCNGPIYRNSHITYAAVTDGLSNTVVAGERTPYLSDATWVGIIPGYRHFAYNAFASLGTGGLGVNYDYANSILAAHSGPSLYEDPVVIHPPNSPLGHTDEMYSLHPGGANVLMGDGSVRFVRQSINLLTWAAMSSRSNGEVISADCVLSSGRSRGIAVAVAAPRPESHLARGVGAGGCRLWRAFGPGAEESPGARGFTDGHFAQECRKSWTRTSSGLMTATPRASSLTTATRPPGNRQESPGRRLERRRETGLRAPRVKAIFQVTHNVM